MARRAVLAVLGLGALLTPALWWASRPGRERAELRRAVEFIERGEPERARPIVGALARRSPGRAEVEFALGLCERDLGRPREAMEAWSRVPAGSVLAARAARLRVQTARESGYLAGADGVDPASLTPAGIDDLVFVLRCQGRLDEAREALRSSWDRSEDPTARLRELWALDHEPFPIDGVRTLLEGAARRAPTDDRVWLGLAHVATRSGRLDEASERLGACLGRRPHDPAVWWLALQLARARGDPEGARDALAQLPSDRLDASGALGWRAWLASRSGDVEAEHRALADWVEADPTNPTALERSAEVALAEGRPEVAAEYRARKAARDEAQRRYEATVHSPDAADSADELARLAESFGGAFEARAWWTLAARRRPGDREPLDALARLDRTAPPRPTAPARSLADVVLGPAGPSGTARRRAAHPTAAPAAWPVFRDDAEASGLRFRFDNGKSARKQLPETMSGGVGLLDYDGDGRLDVYAAQGGPFPPPPGAPCADRLFRNLGGGAFEDVSEAAGLAALPGGYGHGVAVGDVDNDGHPDVLVTRWRSYLLLRNRGDGTFEDATAAWGLGGDRDWPTSAAFADLDGDGDLDLYVCHYLRWDLEGPTGDRPERASGPATYNNPAHYPALPDRLFRNDGGRFADVTAEAGIVDADGRGLGVVAADLDDDGRVDLFVADDTTANLFFRNLGGMRFREEAVASGLASNAYGGYLAGMGVACGDLDGDGRLDLAVTNFYGEGTTFYHNLGSGNFADHGAAIGLALPSRPRLGFGAAFLDANNDGLLDLLTVNGHVDDYAPAYPYAMPAQLLVGVGEGRLIDATERAGPAVSSARVGRGLAVGDLDNDGRLDALIVSYDRPLAYLRNVTEPTGHWLVLGLEGTASNRDGVGARVAVTAGGRRRVAERFGGGSYLSASDPRLHFGLGESARADLVEVRWPSGRLDVHRDLPADAAYRLREGSSAVEPLAGFPGPGGAGVR